MRAMGLVVAATMLGVTALSAETLPSPDHIKHLQETHVWRRPADADCTKPRAVVDRRREEAPVTKSEREQLRAAMERFVSKHPGFVPDLRPSAPPIADQLRRHGKPATTLFANTQSSSEVNGKL